MWRGKSSKTPAELYPCPHCGAEIKTTAVFCRHCGASEESGWDEQTEAWSADDDDFDYDEFLAEEFPEHRPPGGHFKRIVIVMILLGFIATLFAAF